MATAVHDDGPTAAPASSVAFTASMPNVPFATAFVSSVPFATASLPSVAFAAATASAPNASTFATATAALSPHENEVGVIGIAGRQTGESRIQLNAGSKGGNARH
jgi:hypothetical protein